MQIFCRRTWTITCRSGTPASRHPGSCTIRSVSTKSTSFRKAPDETTAHASTTSLSLAHPLPPSPDCRLSLFPSLPLYRRSSLLTCEEVGDGRGAESYDCEKAWPSINNLIFSSCIPFLIRSHVQLTFLRYYAVYLSKPSPPSQHRLHNYLPYRSLSLSPLWFTLCSNYIKKWAGCFVLGWLRIVF
jgi:hypothetical protein